MLKTRIFTALLLIPFIFYGIFALSTVNFAIASGVIFLLTGWEWARAIGFSKRASVLYLLFLAGSLAAIVLASPLVVFILATCTWLAVVYYLFHYEKFKMLWKTKTLPTFLGIWILASAWYAINIIRAYDSGPIYLTFLLCFIWAADSGGYFAGRAYGKNKLAPEISPGKTREGVIGGVVLTVLVAAIIGMFRCRGWEQGLSWLVLGFLISLVSVVGDLFESMVKRQAGLKDSGRLLPGHGGFLDRLDSLLSAAPIFALGLMALLNL